MHTPQATVPTRTRARRATLLSAAAFAAFAGLPSIAGAQTYFENKVQMSIGDLLFEDASSGLLGDTPQALGHQLDAANGDHIRASTVASFGVNKAVAAIHIAQAETPVILAYALSTNQYWDSVTISDAALDGTVGSFTTALLVNGSGSFATSPTWANNMNVEITAQWRSGITVGNPENGYQDNVWAGAWNRDFGNGNIRYVGAPLNDFQQDATFSFIYGQPFVIGVSLQTYISLFNTSRLSGSLDAVLDLGNSVYWGGMTLHDQNGSVVTTSTLDSASGVDWRLPMGVAAVPEPSTYAMFFLGLAGLTLISRHGKPAQSCRRQPGSRKP